MTVLRSLLTLALLLGSLLATGCGDALGPLSDPETDRADSGDAGDQGSEDLDGSYPDEPDLASPPDPVLFSGSPAGIEAAGLLSPGASLADYHVLPYDVSYPLFSDHALKSRWILLPRGAGAMIRSGDGPWAFPVGTVLVKSFGYEVETAEGSTALHLIETRALVLTQRGWTPHILLWGEDGQADEITRGARVRVVAATAPGVPEDFEYGVPSAADCSSCHATTGALLPLGIHEGQLGGLAVDGAPSTSSRWGDEGLLEGPGLADPAAAFPRPDDPGASVSSLARAYLDVNCGHCHNSRSPMGNRLRLDRGQALGRSLGICLESSQGGDTHPWVIEPGAPERSELLRRTQADAGDQRMPPAVAGSLRSPEGEALLTAWIRSLEGSCEER